MSFKIITLDKLKVLLNHIRADINVDDVKVNGASVIDVDKVAQITSYREVTTAEYEALPSSKLTDGVLYCIKDGNGDAYSFPPLIFSLQEREIGVWIDGKPLYQKTVSLEYQTASGNYQVYQHGIANIDQCVSFDGYLFFSDGIQKNRDEAADLKNTMFAFSPTDIMWNIGTTWNYSQPTAVVATLRYTKTTDVAGSGTWTSQGALACHYSTDEHVVGTWIDGSTLYEKTAILPEEIEVHQTNWTATGLYISDGDFVVDCSGINKDGGYQGSLLAYIAGADGEIFLTSSRNGTSYVKWFTIRYTKRS